MSQLFIVITGTLAILLSQQGNKKLHKYACFFGLAGQPFWFYSSWITQQWGIFFMCFVYTFAWSLGFYNYWLKGKKWKSV